MAQNLDVLMGFVLIAFTFPLLLCVTLAINTKSL